MHIALPRFSEEPVVYVGIANALIALALVFGVPIPTEAKVAIDGLIFAGSLAFTRSQVSPVTS